MRASRLMGVLLGCCLFASGAQAGCIMVAIVGGDDLFERSNWVQKNLAKGTSGWLVGDPRTEPYLLEDWQPDTIWDEPGKTPKAKTIRVVSDPSFAYGKRAGFAVRDLKFGTKKQGWQVVFLRDIERAHSYEPLCIPERAATLVKRGWAQVDSFLESISRELNLQNDLLIITTVPMQETDPLANRLHPVFMIGRSVGKGLLQDHSTRMPGFGQCVSLVPTIRHHLMKLPPTHNRQGAKLKGAGNISAIAKLIAIRDERLQRARARQVGTWLPGMWVFLVVSGAWVFEKRKKSLSTPIPAPTTQTGVISRKMLLQKRPRPGATPPAPEPTSPPEPRQRIHPASFALWGVALTLSSFFPALFSPHGWTLALAVMIAGAGILTWCVRFLDSPLLGAGVMCGLGLVMLLLDSFSGGHWSRDGMLAYNPLMGNRYFGVGNEYAALTMAWALFYLACWLQIQGTPLIGVFLLGILMMWLGWKSANFGATLAALGTTLVYTGLLFYPKVKSGKVKWWAWVGTGIIVLLSLWLLWHGTPHLQAFLQEPSAQVLWRKLQMNWGQILFSRWGLLLLLSLWAAWRVRKHLFIDPQMKMLERTWLAAGILMLLLNDSGVLMAACLAFIYWSWLYLHYWQEADLHKKLSHA